MSGFSKPSPDGSSWTPKSRIFFAVLIDHGRLAALAEIVAQYKTEMNRRMGIAEAEVVTARRLDGQERVDMERHVEVLAEAKSAPHSAKTPL